MNFTWKDRWTMFRLARTIRLARLQSGIPSSCFIGWMIWSFPTWWRGEIVPGVRQLTEEQIAEYQRKADEKHESALRVWLRWHGWAVYLSLALLFLLLFVGTTAHCQTAQYRHNGNAILNDLQQTPGAVRAGCTAVEICSPDFRTGPIRATIHNFAGLKKKSCALYGLEKCDGSTEGDHLISIELCGCPDCLTNIWPEPYHPVAPNSWEGGAKDKDVVENAMHKWVCADPTAEVQVTRLRLAQKCISQDWTTCQALIAAEAKLRPKD